MNQLVKIVDYKGSRIVNARELHEFLESKQEFTSWIKNRIEKYGFVENQDFISFDKIIKREKGATKRKEYGITIDTAKELSMVENNEKGRQARRYFIEAEKQRNLMLKTPDQMNRLELLKLAVEQEEQKLALEAKIEEQRPKVRYAEAVAASDDMILVREWCKQISSEAGITIGQNRAFKWLRVNKFLNSKNEPYQKWIDAKIFHVKSANINTVDHSFNKPTTMITGKGRIYLSKRLFDDFSDGNTQNKLNF